MGEEDLSHFIPPPPPVNFVALHQLCHLSVPHFLCLYKRGVKVPSSDGFCKLIYVKCLGQRLAHKKHTISSCFCCRNCYAAGVWIFEECSDKFAQIFLANTVSKWIKSRGQWLLLRLQVGYLFNQNCSVSCISWIPFLIFF